MGCPYDAKQDMRLTYLKDAIETEMTTVFTGTKAESIDYRDKNHQIVTAVIKSEGASIKIKTSRTIVAGGAIMTPLLLQKSGLTKGGNVGKYLHLHPVLGSLGVYPHEIHPTYGIPMSAYSHEYQDLDGKGYGIWQEVPDLEVFLAGVNFPGIGETRRELMKQFNNMGVILTLTRDGASGKSAGEVKWKRGLNLQSGHFSLKQYPSIQYKIDPVDKKHALLGLENAIDLHFAAGATEVLPMHSYMYRLKSLKDKQEFFKLPMGTNQLSVFSAHPTGSARMGKDEQKHVVDETMQLHHYHGVYVMDGSTLPTAPGVNPMVSILGAVSRALELGNAGF
jgi:choline dehydrogenase-like flavoprotein